MLKVRQFGNLQGCFLLYHLGMWHFCGVSCALTQMISPVTYEVMRPYCPSATTELFSPSTVLTCLALSSQNS